MQITSASKATTTSLISHRSLPLDFSARYGLCLTPSLPSQYNLRARKCPNMAANSIFYGPIANMISVVCALVKLLSRTTEKKKEKEKAKGF